MQEEPPPRLIRTPDDAELVAADWLRFFGFRDVRAFVGAGADGGVDLRGTGVVGQVKATTTPVGRPVIQQTYGIAAAEECQAVVFSLGGYTAQAIEWADTAGVMLFRFDLQGRPVPCSVAAGAISAVSKGGETVADAVEALSSLRELERLCGEILDCARDLQKEVQDGAEAKAAVEDHLPVSIDDLRELAKALENHPPEALFDSQTQIDTLEAAVETSGIEELELADAMNRFAVLIDEFAAERDRWGLLDEDESTPFRRTAHEFIEVVERVSEAVTPILPRSTES